MPKHSKYCIIGAGLSGLTTAYSLLKKGETNFVILESRNRIGGRLLTKNTVDLGATWLQNYHSNLLELIKELGLTTFNQFSKGKSILVYNTMTSPHYFETDSNAPPAMRIVGGSLALANALAEPLEDKIILNTKVKSITETGNNIIISTNNGYFSTEKAIITLPPKLANQLLFTPPLPEHLQREMDNTHTWMSNAIKVGISYATPFWKTIGFSGTIVSQIAPLTELYDHSSHNASSFTLMGFANETLSPLSVSDRKEIILKHIERYLGKETRNYLNYFEKDWSLDEFTSSKKLNSYYLTPKYGNPIFDKFYVNKTVLFSGTETASQYGGYMEGAVISGLNAAKKVLEI